MPFCIVHYLCCCVTHSILLNVTHSLAFHLHTKLMTMVLILLLWYFIKHHDEIVLKWGNTFRFVIIFIIIKCRKCIIGLRAIAHYLWSNCAPDNSRILKVPMVLLDGIIWFWNKQKVITFQYQILWQHETRETMIFIEMYVHHLVILRTNDGRLLHENTYIF